MNRIFVSEILCGGGWVEPGCFGDWAPALLSEAWAMLAAVTADLAAIDGVQVTTLLDDRLTDRSLDPRVEVIRVRSESEEPAFREQAGRADFALIIAPEMNGVLHRRCEMARAAGADLLGPTPEAVALTADKLALARHWRTAGVPTPMTHRISGGPPPFPPPWIVKPRFGAGSVGLMRVHSPSELPLSDESVLQPFIPGRAASVAFLVGPNQTIALPPCWQHLDESMHYLGGTVPIPPEFSIRACAVAAAAVSCLSDLAGYVGADVVLGEEDMAIEINPRLTTSYIGLRRLSAVNLAEAMLRMVTGDVVELSWHDARVDFRADGSVSSAQTGSL